MAESAQAETVVGTFLFTDLVGSTALSSSMSAEAADNLRRTHFGLLRGAMSATGGNEVKNLGDGLMVMFMSPSRAVACAVAMQQAVDRYSRRAEFDLAIRVGMATGEATVEGADFFGDPVIEASRLCAHAEGGQILATELLCLNLGRHSSWEFTPIGSLQLKGLPEPVATLAVSWEPEEPSESDRPPLPRRLASSTASALFGFSGRGTELERLLDAQKQSAVEARLQVVLVSGEPGVGKTSLAAQTARIAHGQGVTVLFGACPEGMSAPYQPWISALSHLVGHCPAEVLGRLSVVHAGALRRLLPADAPLLPEGTAVEADAETEQYLLMDSVMHLLALASAHAAVLLVIDDLHWADAASLALLRHLISSSAQLQLSIVGSYRDSDLSPSHPLTGVLADLHRESSVSRVSLGGLDDTEIVELVETARGYQLDDAGVALAHALRRETGGNPFFVGELLRHLGESGAIVQDESGRFSLVGDLEELALPPSVRDVVIRRVARLGDEALWVLSVAAVIGQDFALDLLGEVTETDPDPLLDVLEQATTAALVIEAPEDPGRYRFTHALIQHTLYQELSAARRQRLHLLVAEALEGLAVTTVRWSSHLAELARHWQAATSPTNAAKAINYSRRAGDAAKAALALADAARWYAQAVELAERDFSTDPALRCHLLISLAAAQLPADAALGRSTLREAGALAEQIGDPEIMISWALTRVYGAQTSESADPEVLRLTRQALASVGSDKAAIRARLLAALADETDPSEWQERCELAKAARAAAAEADDEAAVLEVFLMTSFMTPVDQVTDELGHAARAVGLAEKAGNPVNLASALFFRLSVEMAVGDFASAQRSVARLTALAESFALPTIEILAAEAHAACSMAVGDLGTLEREAEAVLNISGKVPSSLAIYGGCLFELRWAQGRLSEFAAMFADAATEMRSYAGFRPALVLAYLEAGEVDRARSVFADDASDQFVSFPRDAVWSACMTIFAEVAIRLDDEDAAIALYDLLLPFGDLHCAAGPIYYGIADRTIGNLAGFLGRADEAERRLRHALEVQRGIGPSYWTARTAAELADCLLDRDGKRDGMAEVIQLLDEASRVAEAGGYGAVTRRVAEVRAQRDAD